MQFHAIIRGLVAGRTIPLYRLVPFARYLPYHTLGFPLTLGDMLFWGYDSGMLYPPW